MCGRGGGRARRGRALPGARGRILTPRCTHEKRNADARTEADADAHTRTRALPRWARGALYTSLRYTILLDPLQRAGGLRACHPLARHVTKARVHACLVGTQPCTEGALRGEVGKHGEGASVNERRDDEEDEVDQPLRRGMRSGAGLGACGACGTCGTRRKSRKSRPDDDDDVPGRGAAQRATKSIAGALHGGDVGT